MADQDQTGKTDDAGQTPESQSAQSATVSKGLVKDTVLHVVPKLQQDLEDNRLAIERIRVQSEATKSEKALSYSIVIWAVLFFSHLMFFAFGRPLLLPEWLINLSLVMIASPWVGHGIGRLVNGISDKLEKK